MYSIEFKSVRMTYVLSLWWLFLLSLFTLMHSARFMKLLGCLGSFNTRLSAYKQRCRRLLFTFISFTDRCDTHLIYAGQCMFLNIRYCGSCNSAACFWFMGGTTRTEAISPLKCQTLNSQICTVVLRFQGLQIR